MVAACGIVCGTENSCRIKHTIGAVIGRRILHIDLMPLKILGHVLHVEKGFFGGGLENNSKRYHIQKHLTFGAGEVASSRIIPLRRHLLLPGASHARRAPSIFRARLRPRRGRMLQIELGRQVVNRKTYATVNRRRPRRRRRPEVLTHQDTRTTPASCRRCLLCITETRRRAPPRFDHTRSNQGWPR